MVLTSTRVVATLIHFVSVHWWFAAAVVVGVAACGGKSQSDDDGGAGTNDAGTASDAGTGGNSGGNAGKGGLAGKGGGPAQDARCTAPVPEREACDGDGFYFLDTGSGECHGSGPRLCGVDGFVGFATLAECLATCSGSKPAPNACDVAADCMLAIPGCCGGCEPVDPAIYVPVHQLRGDVIEGCDATCGPCADVTELETTGQYYVPACVNQACAVRDLREMEATECSRGDECTLRLGSRCCPSCSTQGLIAVSSFDWLDEVCPDDVACPDCASVPREEYEAFCDEDAGRCFVGEITATDN
jgi:hypothetical protein